MNVEEMDAHVLLQRYTRIKKEGGDPEEYAKVYFELRRRGLL